MPTLVQTSSHFDRRLGESVVERIRKALKEQTPKASVDNRTSFRHRFDQLKRRSEYTFKLSAQAGSLGSYWSYASTTSATARGVNASDRFNAWVSAIGLELAPKRPSPVLSDRRDGDRAPLDAIPALEQPSRKPRDYPKSSQPTEDALRAEGLGFRLAGRAVT